MKKNLLKNEGVQAIITSLVCIILGIIVGFVVLFVINPSGAFEGILAILKNFMNYSQTNAQLRYFGNTIVKTIPLILCSLSILFAYKAGLFNIGAAGQYCVGICASLYAALAWEWSFIPCTLLAIFAGALYGGIVGIFKSYFNVNEVISGIMLNWIGLYFTNSVLSTVKDGASPYTIKIRAVNESALIPSMGLDKFFNNNQYITIAVPIAIIIAVVIYFILDKTRLGYEIKATGFNKSAAKYAGMAENKNIILTLVIAGGLAGLGAAFLYLTGFEEYMVTSTSVPTMGFNGIAAAFLGGLNPFGVLLSSFFIQHITSGGAYVDKSIYASQISDLISATIIYLCGFALFAKTILNSKIAKHEEKKALVDSKQGGKN